MSNNYAGMTVNERLFKAKLLDIWNKAIQTKDRKSTIEILLKVEFDEQQAAGTVDAVFNNPLKYGYH